MSENLGYGLFSLIVGIISLYIGMKLKKPSWAGGVVRKYGLIAIGILGIINGIILLLRYSDK
ncbi:hypothetical protein BH10BAC2_BH10BAC2_48320 [soil metagenome]